MEACRRGEQVKKYFKRVDSEYWHRDDRPEFWESKLCGRYSIYRRRCADLKYALNNSLGFGGHNACLLFKKWD